jgi:hypothetical protein
MSFLLHAKSHTLEDEDLTRLKQPLPGRGVHSTSARSSATRHAHTARSILDTPVRFDSLERIEIEFLRRGRFRLATGRRFDVRRDLLAVIRITFRGDDLRRNEPLAIRDRDFLPEIPATMFLRDADFIFIDCCGRQEFRFRQQLFKLILFQLFRAPLPDIKPTRASST